MDEEIDSNQTDGSQFVVDPVNGSMRSIYNGLYMKTFSYTKHYNAIQTKHKGILRKWLLATFLAFGYILAGKEISAPIDKMLLIALVSFFSSTGVLLIFYLDAGVYHRLLNAAFSVGLEMEMKGYSKARIHKNMMKLLLPEYMPDTYEEYKKNISPWHYKFKQCLSYVLLKNKKSGLDPIIYDGLIYCMVCFCLWNILGAAVLTYLFFHGYKIFVYVCGPLIPFVLLIACIFLLKKTLQSGIEKFKEKRD